MAYNNGIFSQFTFAASATNIFASLNNPRFNPPTGSVVSNAHALAISPTITPTGGTVTNAISLLVNSPSGAVSNYSMLVRGTAPIGFGATPSISYFLIGATVTDTSIVNIMRNAGVYRSAAAINPNGSLEATAFRPPTGTVYGTASGVEIAATRGGSGTVTSLQNLIVNQPTGGDGATVTNVCADFKGLTYHQGGVVFGAPGIGGYPNTGADVLRFYVENQSWTPTISGSSTAGDGTYSQQRGYYHRIGSMLFLEANLSWTAHTGSGNIYVNMPFTVRSLTNYSPTIIPNVVNINGGGGFSFWGIQLLAGTAYGTLTAIRNNNVNTYPAMDAIGGMIYSGFYLI